MPFTTTSKVFLLFSGTDCHNFLFCSFMRLLVKNVSRLTNVSHVQTQQQQNVSTFQQQQQQQQQIDDNKNVCSK
jgi:hypothetical protein